MRNQSDQILMEHYTEDREETNDPPKVTPSSAIQNAIFDLSYERRRWEGKEDKYDVLPWIIERIACLEQAQRELAELREIKRALAVLKGVL